MYKKLTNQLFLVGLVWLFTSLFLLDIILHNKSVKVSLNGYMPWLTIAIILCNTFLWMIIYRLRIENELADLFISNSSDTPKEAEELEEIPKFIMPPMPVANTPISVSDSTSYDVLFPDFILHEFSSYTDEMKSYIKKTFPSFDLDLVMTQAPKFYLFLDSSDLRLFKREWATIINTIKNKQNLKHNRIDITFKNDKLDKFNFIKPFIWKSSSLTKHVDLLKRFPFKMINARIKDTRLCTLRLLNLRVLLYQLIILYEKLETRHKVEDKILKELRSYIIKIGTAISVLSAFHLENSNNVDFILEWGSLPVILNNKHRRFINFLSKIA